MTEWITDRDPVQADGNEYGHILITTPDGRVDYDDWRTVSKGMPWMPLPKPYVKPPKCKLLFRDGLCLVAHSADESVVVFRSPITAIAAAVCDTLNKVDP